MIIPKGTVVTIDGKVYRTLEAQVAWNKEELESLDIETLSELPDAFEELDNKVDGIDDRLETAEGDIVDIKEDVQNLDQDINGTGGIEDRLTSAEDNISTSAGDISQLQFDLGQAQGDINALGSTKLNKPENTGDVGDVIVKTATGTEYQSVAPFNPNGTYPNVTVGKAVSAKSLENVSEDSGAEQDEPFFFQATATANNTAETPTAPTFELKKLKGNTIVYNQLVDGVNLTYPTISGHKYWAYISATDYTSIITSTGTSITVSDAQKDKLVDLTRWFNNSIPSAITDDPTVFPINYYDDDLTYSAGEVKNCSCTELKTVGFNLFDKDSVVVGYVVNDSTGNLSPSSGNNASDWIRIPMGMKLYQNVSFVGNYLAFYDIRKQYISGIGSHVPGILNTPENACYIRITVDDAHLDTMNLNLHWDGERDGTYEPYVSHTYPMVWSGKSAGSAYDEKLPDGTEITRIASYTFTGSETWSFNSDSSVSTSSNILSVVGELNSICNTSILEMNSCRIISNNGYRIRLYIDTSVYDTEAKVQALTAGKTLLYERATPITSSGDAFTSVIEGDDYGTMSFDSVVPMGNEFFYPADYSLLIDDLGNYTDYDVTALAKKSDLIPAPVGDGTYTLKAVVSGGTVTYTWEAVS